MIFSETVVVCDSCSQLNEYMKLYEYQRSFIDLGPNLLRFRWSSGLYLLLPLDDIPEISRLLLASIAEQARLSLTVDSMLIDVILKNSRL